MRAFLFCRLGLRGLGLVLASAITSAWGANLSAIHDLAKAHDAEFAAARQAYLAGLEKEPQARASLRPSVSLSASYGRTESDSLGYSPYGYTLALSQPLYAPAAWAGLEQGKAQSALARIGLRKAEQDLILRVAAAYFDVLKAAAALDAVKAQQTAIAEQLAQAKKGFEVGTLTITDTHEAQARADLVHAQAIEAENALAVKRRALEKLIQAPLPVLAQWSDSATALAAPQQDGGVWATEAEKQGLGVQVAQLNVRLAEQGLQVKRADYRPKIGVTASYNDSRNTLTFNPTSPIGEAQTRKVGVELSWPLYEGGRTNSGVREAQASIDKARFEVEDARRSAALAAREAYLGVLSGLSRLQALEAAVRSSQLQLDSTRLGLEVGIRTRIDVLNAQQQLYVARKDVVAARYDLMLASLKLKATRGDLVADDLASLDARLN